ncbi:hypothetical protein [Novosphingobium sp. BL-52-GroH]|uniref:hypothetical protein n=1 Tax=Novosphingobium sp. BL-52-GroH TaxID=3349877 RepID=UPI00384EABCA
MLASIAGILFLANVAQAQSLEDRARAAADASRARTGSSESLQGNYIAPGLGGGAVSTIDQSVSFTPSLSCQTTATLLQVMIQPGNGGDIHHVQVSQDTDMDGSFDRTSTLTRPISGVCANGVISCDPGTWNQCRNFAWAIDNAGALSLREVELPELAGCYCINDSCGANLAWSNIADVLKDIGGGMVGALTTADPRIGIAVAQVSPPTISYVGSQSTACTSDTQVSQTRYRASPALIQSDAAASASASTIFQQVAASPAGTGRAQQSRSCTIERVVTIASPGIDDILQRVSGGYAENRTGSGSIDFLMGSPSNDSLSGGSCSLFDFRMTLHVSDADRISAARLTHYFADDWAQIRIDGQLIASGPSAWTSSGLPPGKCERKATFHVYPDFDLRGFLTAGDHEIWLRAAVADGGEAFAQIHVQTDDSCSTKESIANQCAGYAGDAQCNLAEEDVDGVVTLRSGVATGLRPLAQTRQFGADRCAVSLTRDFFTRKRTYSCLTDTSGLTQPDLTRGAFIIDHSTETMLADQRTAADGTLVQTTNPFSMPPRGSVPACEAVCKTRAPQVNTQATPTGVTGSQQNDPSGWDTFYHICGADNVCPAGAGESIITGCGCLDDFPEAVVMMQSVRLAGADMTCTRVVR